MKCTVTGRDCIGCAKTGSGKTATFALPILQKLSEDPYGIFALVVTPTRYAFRSHVVLFCLSRGIVVPHPLMGELRVL